MSGVGVVRSRLYPTSQCGDLRSLQLHHDLPDRSTELIIHFRVILGDGRGFVGADIGCFVGRENVGLRPADSGLTTLLTVHKDGPQASFS